MDRVEDEKQKTDPPQVEESAPELETASIPPADVASPQQTAPQPTEKSTQSTKTRTSGGTRSVCAMHKVVIKKARGENFKVRFNQVGLPVGDGRHKLQSYLGMLARTMVPIDIPSWPKVDPELKEKLWNDLQVRQLSDFFLCYSSLTHCVHVFMFFASVMFSYFSPL